MNSKIILLSAIVLSFLGANFARADLVTPGQENLLRCPPGLKRIFCYGPGDNCNRYENNPIYYFLGWEGNSKIYCEYTSVALFLDWILTVSLPIISLLILIMIRKKNAVK
jgi:hypothetical protein